MLSRSVRRQAVGTRLFLVYAVASLIPVVLLGAFLAVDDRRKGVERGLAQGRAHAAIIEKMVISPTLRGTDLSSRLTTAERDRLSTATSSAIARGSVRRLLLRSFEGSVVFSDDGSTYGAVPADHAPFRQAASGRVHVAVVDFDHRGRALRVLQPVVADATGEEVGVLEVYLPFEAIDAEVRASSRRTLWVLGGALLALYVGLGAVSWSTTHRLSRHAAQREHQALHDPLTGLANRELFRERLAAMADDEDGGAVVLVDLDRFKEVNDTLGHHAGDDLLVEVGRRLSEGLRTDDTVARLGGDEFGILLPGNQDADAVRDLLERLRDRVADEMVLAGVALAMEASFGLAMCPRDGQDAESLLHCADVAMYQSKRGLGGVVAYDGRLDVSPSQQLRMQHDVREAMDRDELVLHYQPLVSLGSGRAGALEALVRWDHPVRGLLMPADFLPSVERSGLIHRFTDWVLQQALSDLAQWSAEGQEWNLSVNVSARNLDAAGFPEKVFERLRDAGVSSDRLRLEVTETAVAVDATAAAQALEVLAGGGVEVALDDFGVGYASLSHLRTLAVAEIKIDRSFVQRIRDSEHDREVVRSLIDMAHGLDLRVTAEGVETAAVGAWLRDAGCDVAQGYHYARPAPWRDLLALQEEPQERRLATR